MKHRIFLYLFILVSLVCIFQWINSRNAFSILAADNLFYKSENQKLNDSIVYLSQQLDKKQKSSHLSATDSIFLQRSGIQPTQIWLEAISYLQQKQGVIVKEVEIINSRWILADLTEEEQQKSVLLRYEADSESHISFHIVDEFILTENF